MPIPAQRIITSTVDRDFGRFGDAVGVPDLTEVQTRSYDRFLQLDVAWDRRTQTGLEGALAGIPPASSANRTNSCMRVLLLPTLGQELDGLMKPMTQRFEAARWIVSRWSWFSRSSPTHRTFLT